MALPPGELTRQAVEELGELERGGNLLDAGADFPLGYFLNTQGKTEIIPHRHVGVQRIALEDHRDVALLGRQVIHDGIAEAQRARSDLL